MKKRLILFFTILTLAAVATETYKGYLLPNYSLMDIGQENDGEKKEIKEKAGEELLDKYFHSQQVTVLVITLINRRHIHHCSILPDPYISRNIHPPEFI